MTEATQVQDATQGNEQQGEQQQTQEPVKFEDWYGKLEDGQKDLIDDHVSGLKSALDSERSERRKLAADLKKLGKTAEEGSELQQQLQKMTGELESAEAKATFFEQAHTEGVSNLRLAWVAAKEEGLINRGTVDFVKLREIAPELFAKKVTTPTGNAGTGAGQTGTVKPDMNNFLRAAAGRQR